MGFRGLVLLVIVLAVAIPGITSQGSAQTPANTVYIALGDSIAAGIGSSLPERRGYPALLSELLEAQSGGSVELTNLAIPGETAESFLSGNQINEFASTVGRYNEGGVGVDLVTISLGGNELLTGQSGGAVERQQALATFRESLDEVVARVRGEVGDDTGVVLTTYYDPDAGDPSISSSDAWWIEQFNEVIRDTAQQHNAQVAEVGDAFRGRIDEYTHYPYDVHPKNQGYRAIAQQVWRAIGWDSEPPDIQVLSRSEVTRRTPTLQLSVTDNVDVASVVVAVGDGAQVEPVDLGSGRYALLLDFRGDDALEYVITIEARDSAANVGRAEQQVVIQIDE